MAPPAAAARYSGYVLAGRYRLGRMLGEGGMGAVYEAQPLDRPGAMVAVKMLHDEMSANATVVERFEEEGRVMSQRLDHPGILRVSEVGRDRNVPYLVMELLQGRALIDYTEHHQKLPPNFAVTVAAGVLHALDYAHRQGIVHRDLKPENVFLVPGPDGQYHTKLLDFGIAKCIDAAGGARRKTATGVLLGTPGYMSPEQVKGARAVDHRADLWAVGVMFYEMIAGASPFPSDGDDPNNIWGLISAVLTKDPIPLSRIDPSIAQYDAFIARALCKNVDQRYSTAREMCEDLLRIARGERPMPSTPPPSAMADVARQPINSRGELAHIPPVMGQAQPRSVQITPVSGSGDINSTMPTGGPNAGNAQLAATMPVDSVMAQQQLQQIQQARMQVAAYQVPMQGGPMTPQSGIAGTAYAPPNPNVFPTQGSGMSPVPPSPYGASPVPPSPMSPQPMSPPMQGSVPPGATPLPPTPRYGTAPTGYQPPPQPAQGGGMGILPWLLLGAFLLGALAFAVIWLLS